MSEVDTSGFEGKIWVYICELFQTQVLSEASLIYTENLSNEVLNPLLRPLQ